MSDSTLIGMATRLDDGTWEIQGRRLTFPVRIGDAAAACATYVVRADAARTLVAGTGLDLVTVAGRTPLFLALVDYKINDLGDYAELGVALLARHRGRTGPYVHQLPVTQTFTMEAGRALWGLPKWLGTADLTISGGAADGRLADAAGLHVLTAGIRAMSPRLPFPLRATIAALAPRDGSVLVSPVSARLRDVRLGRSAALVLGDGHPMAGELRALGLPRRPLLTAVVEHVTFDMEAAQVVPA
jgi:Acetoacetate decarboxylase (ADC)